MHIIDNTSDTTLLSEYESFAPLGTVPLIRGPQDQDRQSAPKSNKVPMLPSLAARPRVGYPAMIPQKIVKVRFKREMYEYER